MAAHKPRQPRPADQTDRPQHNQIVDHQGILEERYPREIVQPQGNQTDRSLHRCIYEGNQQQPREGHQNVGDAHDSHVDNAAHIGRERAQDKPQHRVDHGYEDGNHDGCARALQNAAEHIPSDFIGAHRMFQRRRLHQGSHIDEFIVIGGQGRAEDPKE